MNFPIIKTIVLKYAYPVYCNYLKEIGRSVYGDYLWLMKDIAIKLFPPTQRQSYLGIDIRSHNVIRKWIIHGWLSLKPKTRS